MSDDELAHFPPPTAEATELRKIERPSPLTGLANAWLVVVAIVFFGGREVLEQDISPGDVSGIIWLLLGGLGIVAVLALGVGLIQWRTTTFVVDHEFRIERRFLATSTTRIDFTKVQSVDIHRPLIARILGLAEVRIDVGSQSSQSLRFLRMARAESLRDHLLERMEQDPRTGGAPGAHALPDAPGGTELYRASTANILLGALLSVSLFSLLIAAGFIVGLTIFARHIPFYLWIIVIGVLWQVPKQLLTNWGFTLTRVAKGLHVKRGALTQVQMTLRPDRVQAVALQQTMLMRLAGLYTMRLTVLGNSLLGEESDNIDVLVPFGRWDEARYVLSLVWPDVDPDRFAWHPQAPRGRRLSWFATHEFAVTDAAFASRHRLLSTSTNIVPLARIQGMGISQGPLQRWLRLGRVVAHTIDGPVQVSAYHLEAADCRGLFEDLLTRSAAARTNPSAEAHRAMPE